MIPAGEATWSMYWDALLENDLDTAAQALELRQALGVGCADIVARTLSMLMSWATAHPVDYPSCALPALTMLVELCCGEAGMPRLAAWLNGIVTEDNVRHLLYRRGGRLTAQEYAAARGRWTWSYRGDAIEAATIMGRLHALGHRTRCEVEAALLACYCERTGEVLL